MKKISRKPVTRGNISKSNKGDIQVYISIMINGKILKAFMLKLRRRKECPFPQLFFSIVIKVLARAI